METVAESAPLNLLGGLVPLPLIEEAVATLCDLVTAAGGPPSGGLDARVSALAAANRPALGAVYDAMRDSEIFRRIVTCPSLVEAARSTLGASRLHSPFQHCVFRMDLAGEPWRGFGWHQDYPYNMLSDNYLTAWLPLTPSGAHNGSIEAVPSRSDRIHPVEIRFKRDAEGRRGNTRDAFIAARLQPVFDAEAVRLELSPGDVALFHNRLVHRSGFNPGPAHRYSIQVRFGDLLAPDIRSRAWRHRSADGFDTFKALHPDLVEFEEHP
jgi:hypothetical protein